MQIVPVDRCCPHVEPEFVAEALQLVHTAGPVSSRLRLLDGDPQVLIHQVPGDLDHEVRVLGMQSLRDHGCLLRIWIRRHETSVSSINPTRQLLHREFDYDSLEGFAVQQDLVIGKFPGWPFGRTT